MASDGRPHRRLSHAATRRGDSMRHLRAALARVVGFFVGQRADADLRDELEAHLEMETAENIRRGLPPDEARRRARLASGGLTTAAEAVRAQRGLPWIESILADVRYAVRSLRHSRAFTTVVVVTLALGIGANTAIFSVIRAVLLKPLPHRDGDRLVYLRHSVDGPGGNTILFSVPEVRDLRDGVRSFAGLAEYSPWAITAQEKSAAVRMNVGLVTGNFFDVMGLAPVLGRLTRPSDDGPGVPPVMVLTHDFWIRHFGGDPGIVGKTLRLDGGTVTVIGVLQPAPMFPDRMDALCNMVLSPHHLSAQMVQVRSHRMTEIVARLAPNASVEGARTEVASVYARMQRDYKEAYDPGSHYRVSVVPFKEAIGEQARLTLWMFMAAAAFVLIISTANVVNLTLMRGVRREPELIVRAALGAGVARLRRLLLVENLVLTIAGGILGVAAAIGGIRLLATFAQRYSPRANEIRLDVTTLLFALGVSVAVAFLLSFVAALPREGRFGSWMAAGARRISGTVRRQRLQRGLVVAQIAVSVVLLAGAGLLTRTMVELSDVHTGLRTEEVLTMPVQLVSFADGNFERVVANDAGVKNDYDRMMREVRSLPGVVGVGLGSTPPLRGSDFTGVEVKAEGRTFAVGDATPRAGVRTADPEYFRAAGIPLLKGRAFESTDRVGAARVVIINQVLAEKLFRGEDPIGRRVAWTGDIVRLTPFSPDWR